jgi:hypothetical protein
MRTRWVTFYDPELHYLNIPVHHLWTAVCLGDCKAVRDMLDEAYFHLDREGFADRNLEIVKMDLIARAENNLDSDRSFTLRLQLKRSK